MCGRFELTDVRGSVIWKFSPPEAPVQKMVSLCFHPNLPGQCSGSGKRRAVYNKYCNQWEFFAGKIGSGELSWAERFFPTCFVQNSVRWQNGVK